MKKSIIQFVIVALIAFVAGFFLTPPDFITGKKTRLEESPVETVKQAFFTCPMHPHIHEGHEGDCPICGMSLVKKEVDSTQSVGQEKSERPEVYVQSSVINNFGIKTERAVRDSLSKKIHIYGYVNKVKKPDSILLKSPVSGSVRFINKSNEGNKFYKTEMLVALESSEILELQQKYLHAVRAGDLGASRQLKQKLSKLGYTFGQIKELLKTQKPSNIYRIRCPGTGLLSSLKVKLKQKIRVGQVIAEFQPLYSISAVSKVYESQWIWLKSGQKITMKIRSLPGPIWHGEVRRVDDLGQSSTTAVKLFADFEDHKDVRLRLGMQTEMTVYAESKEDVLQVPSSAVIHTGSKTVVVVAKGGGHFQPVDVVTGLNNDEYVEIVSGLKEGMKVVVAGQFLLDSESELRAEISRMTSPTQEIKH